MYGQSTVSLMPDYSDYDLWDQYMGRLWFGLMTGAELKADATVIEVAPGATAKIPHALSQLNFHGRLYLIEPHRQCGPLVLEKAVRLLPDAEVILLTEGFQEAHVPEGIDAIVANHPFDDFLSAYATRDTEKRQVLFQDISQEAEAVLAILRETWQHLGENPAELAAIQQRVREDWRTFIDRHHPSTVILSQYASSYFDKHGLSAMNTHAKDVYAMVCDDCLHPKARQAVQAILDHNENYRNAWIGHELLNAENWVIDDRTLEK